MKLSFSLIFNLKFFLLFFLFLFLISIPLNTKKFILTFDFPLNEFNSVFLYLSDLTLFFFVLILFIFIKKKKLNFDLGFKSKLFLFIFLIFLIFLIFISENKILALVFFIRIIFLVLLFISLFFLFFNNLIKLKTIIFVFLFLGFFESLIGILQFLNGHSLNLWFLGEPVANQFMKGVARYQVLNFSFLRSFGTLPHANIYAAFLVLTLSCFYYFWFLNFKRKEVLKRIILGVLIFLNILALIYSFSRSGWLAGILITLLFLFFGFLKKEYRLKALFLFVIFLFFYFLIDYNLGWLIKPRVVSLERGSPSVDYRLIYNQIGFDIFKNNIFGVGLANQVVYAVNNFYYQKFGLEEKIDFQPIHNLYLLVLTEWGIIGFILFLFLIFLPFYFVFKNKFLLNNLNYVWLFFVFITFLFLGFMDHYFYTLQSGRLMFFLIFSLLLVFSFLNKNDIIKL